MKYNYVAIEREYGSGGRLVAEILSKECGIPCYGKEILEMVSEELKIPVEQIEEYEEKTTNSFLYSVFVLSSLQSGRQDLVSDEGRIYMAEQKAIQHLSFQGPAIFVGRCAACALKDRDDVLRVFIHASMESRIKRCVKSYGISPANVSNIIKKFDKKRSSYYYANTAQKWNSSDNYDMVLDSSTLGIDGCAESVKALLKMVCEDDY